MGGARGGGQEVGHVLRLISHASAAVLLVVDSSETCLMSQLQTLWPQCGGDPPCWFKRMCCHPLSKGRLLTIDSWWHFIVTSLDGFHCMQSVDPIPSE